jgi:hypothetical protein
VERGIVETSPCQGLREPAKSVKRDRVLDREELVVLSEELAVDMISMAFIVELIVLFSGFPGVAVFVRLK